MQNTVSVLPTPSDTMVNIGIETRWYPYITECRNKHALLFVFLSLVKFIFLIFFLFFWLPLYGEIKICNVIHSIQDNVFGQSQCSVIVQCLSCVYCILSVCLYFSLFVFFVTTCGEQRCSKMSMSAEWSELCNCEILTRVKAADDDDIRITVTAMTSWVVGGAALPVRMSDRQNFGPLTLQLYV